MINNRLIIPWPLLVWRHVLKNLSTIISLLMTSLYQGKLNTVFLTTETAQALIAN